MSGGLKQILSPSIVGKKQKAWIKTIEKYMPKEKTIAEIDRGSYNNQGEWWKEFLDNKGAFYNGSESDDSDNDDENYNGSIEAVVCRCS